MGFDLFHATRNRGEWWLGGGGWGGVALRVGDLAFVWRISDNLCIYLWLDPVFFLIVDFVFPVCCISLVVMHFCGIFVGGGWNSICCGFP